MEIEAELKKLSVEALKDLYNNLTSAKQFVLSQAPDIFQQMITWQIWKGGILLFCVIFSISLFLYFFRLQKNVDITKDENIIYFLAPAISGVISIAFIGFSFNQIMLAIKAIVAPKFYLMTEIMNIIQ